MKKFAEYMYDNADLYLSRKRERFDIFLGPAIFILLLFYNDVLYSMSKDIEIIVKCYSDNI